MKALRAAILVSGCMSAAVSFGWGPDGHQTVGAIAGRMIVGTRADRAVKRILGKESLQIAALWADCAKGVTGTPPLEYVVNPRFAECAVFETPQGQRAMVRYVKRNFDGCHPDAGDEVCHKQYHYTDVAIERDTYSRTDVGSSDHDIVSALAASITKLKGGIPPGPFAFESKKEALRLLVHLVGDVHQPLHVGAIYLNAAGREVDPDRMGLDPATRTRGGNLVLDAGRNLHAEWDAIPDNLTVAQFAGTAEELAKLVPLTPGSVAAWPAAWATDTLLASHQAFQGLQFGAETPGKTQWPVTEPVDYATARSALQQQQLVKAAARLAQVLEAIFP